MQHVTRHGAGESVSIPADVNRTQIEEAIFEWMIGPRSERDRAIMYDHLFRGLTYEQIAEAHDMSDRQIANIVRRCTKLIFSHIPG